MGNDWFDWTDEVGDGRPRSRHRQQFGAPPWAALLGLGQPPAPAGPKVRRGDVRTAILDVVARADRAGEPVNGYQVIQQIAERSAGKWKPSPGSVYPTVQQLHDEGLFESEDERGRRTIRLTDAGRDHVREHADELARVWAPFESRTGDRDPLGVVGEVGQVMSAVWQIASQGSDGQKRALVDELAGMRKRLYRILGDGPRNGDAPDAPEDDAADDAADEQ